MGAQELISFINVYLQQPTFPLTAEGMPKMIPIRDALLQTSDLGPKVLAQEDAENTKGVTYNQIKLVLAIIGQQESMLAEEAAAVN
jgi:hypothetical protein